MIIDTLNALHKSGTLLELFKAGILSYKVLLYRDIANDVDIAQRSGKTKTEIIADIAVKYKVSNDTVYRAIRTCK